jgi:hypothetical protein
MLAGPPAVAMTYVKLGKGLEPSLYGGGGSPSSKSLLELSFVSLGSAALVSATTLSAAPAELLLPGRGGSEENAGSCSVGGASLVSVCVPLPAGSGEVEGGK